MKPSRFGGYDVPAGAHVVISPSFVHRMDEYWPEPTRFDPLRFAPEAARWPFGHPGAGLEARGSRRPAIGPRQNDDLARLVRAIPDHPREGIVFRDISTLLADGAGFRATIDRLADAVSGRRFDLVAGIEARGFIIAAALAYRLRLGTLMIRKPGKLPGACIGIDYELEYGSDRLEMHVDACARGSEILLVDDLLATGGTASAACELLRRNGANVGMAAFVIELPALGGAGRLAERDIESRALLALDGE